MLQKMPRASEASSSSASSVGHAGVVSHGTNPRVQEQPRQQYHNNQNHPSSFTSKLPQPTSLIRQGNRPFTAGSDDVYSSNYKPTNSNYRPTNHFSTGPPDSPYTNSAGFRYSEVRLNPGSNRRNQEGTRQPELPPGPPYASVYSPNFEIKINAGQRRKDNADDILRLNTQQSQSINTYKNANSPPVRINFKNPLEQPFRIRVY